MNGTKASGLGIIKSIVRRFWRLAPPIARLSGRIATYADMVDACRDVAVVLDVGANRGQFAGRLRMAGFQGRIVSFEPLRDIHERLLATASSDSDWQVAEPLALGDFPGRRLINVASNDAKSSSLLPVTPGSPLHGPGFTNVGDEEIRVETLDAWIAQNPQPAPLALKLDVQGFELHVLDGARATLPTIRTIMLEAPLVPTYEGAPGLTALIDRMSEEGFQLVGVNASTVLARRVMELDLIFRRPDEP